MRLSEKYPWMRWRTIHWIALGCILVGMVLAGIGVLVAGLEARGWQDVVANLAGADLWLEGGFPAPPDAPPAP